MLTPMHRDRYLQGPIGTTLMHAGHARHTPHSALASIIDARLALRFQYTSFLRFATLWRPALILELNVTR